MNHEKRLPMKELLKKSLIISGYLVAVAILLVIVGSMVTTSLFAICALGLIAAVGYLHYRITNVRNTNNVNDNN